MPYDATRVTLGSRPAEQSYINASWLQEPATPHRAWIASQAPVQRTVHDFLSLFLHTPGDASGSLVRKSRPKVILMLTACRESGREKSARYWPKAVGDTIVVKQYVPSVLRQPTSRYERPEIEWQEGSEAPISVTFVSSTPSSREDEKHHKGWRTNDLTLRNGSDEVTIQQVEYLGWQDHGVPDSLHEVLQLLDHVNTLLESARDDDMPSSLVTHCSAGVGRTGSFIAIAWIVRLLYEITKSDYSGVEALIQSADRSPLGSLPSIPIPSSGSKVTERARGLLPSFMQKEEKQGTSTVSAHTSSEIDVQNWDFVMATIDNLRDQRTTMVQTPAQVEFVYEVARTWWQENAR